MTSNAMNQLKTIVSKLNEMFDQDWNISSFNELQGSRLLAIVEKVLRSMNMFTEEKSVFGNGQGAQILNVLSRIKYTPDPPSSSPDAFHEAIRQGQRATVHPVLLFLLTQPAHAQKRFYLGKYVAKVAVPREFVARDKAMQSVIDEHSAAIEAFWRVYSEHAQEERNAAEASELELDIGAMRADIRNVEQRIQAQSEKLLCSSDFFASVQQVVAARKKHSKLQAQIEEDERQLRDQTEVVRSCQRRDKITEVDQLLERNEFYSSSRQIYATIVEDLEAELAVIASVATTPPPSHEDLNGLEAVLAELQQEVSVLQAERVHDTAMEAWKTQAKAMAKQREHLAKQIVKTRLHNEQVLNKTEEVVHILGGDAMKGKVFKEYIADLKALSIAYKERRHTLNAMETEVGILARTLLLLAECEPSLATQIEETKANKVPEEIANLPLLDIKRKVVMRSRDAVEKFKASMEELQQCKDVKAMYLEMLDEYNRLKATFNEQTDFLPEYVESLECNVMKLESLLRLEEDDLAGEERKGDQLQDDLFRYSNMFIEQAGDVSPSEVLARKLGAVKKSLEVLRSKVQLKCNEAENQQRESENVRNIMLMIQNAKMP